MDEPYDAIVLAGGRARRLGGADKPALVVHGCSLLQRAVAAAGGAQRVVAVGPRRAQVTGVRWAVEDPPGGGPVAAIAAGVAHTSAGVVLLLAADLPWIAGAVGPLLDAVSAAAEQIGAAVLVDADGRVNHLAAAWRRPALVTALQQLGDPAGAAVRRLTASVVSAPVADLAGWGRDCDTWEDVTAARAAVPHSG